MTTTTDTKTFTGILRSSGATLPKKEGGRPYWKITIGDATKPKTFNLFREHIEPAKAYAIGKTYEITYTQGDEYPDFVSAREVEPAPAKPANSPSEGVDELSDHWRTPAQIMRTDALHAAVATYGEAVEADADAEIEMILTRAERFMRFIEGGSPALKTIPAEQLVKPQDKPVDTPKPVQADIQQDIRAKLLAMKPANIGDFYNKAMKELGYYSKAKVLAGLGEGVKETDIVDLAHALQTLVLKKYPEAKEA